MLDLDDLGANRVLVCNAIKTRSLISYWALHSYPKSPKICVEYGYRRMSSRSRHSRDGSTYACQYSGHVQHFDACQW